MEQEKMKVKGIVSYVLTDKDGNVKEERIIPNQIQDAGLAAIASLILNGNPGSVDAFDAIAIGSGTGQAVTATTLQNEINSNGGERRHGANVTKSRVTTTKTNDTAQFQTTFTFNGDLAITEAGIFNASAVGDMLAYQDFSVINVANTDNLQITWKVQFS